MRATALETNSSLKKQVLIGIGFISAGIAITSAVVAAKDTNFFVLGAGIIGVFAGTIVIGPGIARPVSLFLGRPAAALRGVTGTMARQNAARNPKRTSRTSSPVLIGVALVTAVSALAASINGQISDIFTEQFKGDYAISSQAQGFGGLSPSLASDISKIDGIKSTTGIGTVIGKIDNKGRTLTVISPDTIEGNYDIGLINSSYSRLDKDGIFISQSLAERENLTVGSVITVVLADAKDRRLIVRALYEHNDLVRDRVISREVIAGTTVSSFDFGVYMSLEDGADNSAVRASLQKAVDNYGQGKLVSLDEYIDEQAGPINQLVVLIYGLLILSVIIAIVGIIITLLLSVFERQRELGLLRAVGMTRTQVRTTVRWESVITSLLGAVTGIILGIGLGWVIVFALKDQGLTSFQIPIGTTIFIMVMSFLVGIIAAIYPAWRATKVDILSALNTN
jgi:putative ABC transport system permease protein